MISVTGEGRWLIGSATGLQVLPHQPPPFALNPARSGKLNGEMVYLWRAVDQEGDVLESYTTRMRDKSAALTFMK